MQDLADGLQKLLAYSGDVADLGLTFSTVREEYGEKVTVDLVENGAGIPVTDANRDEYVREYVRHVLYASVERQFGAFKRGFERACAGGTVAMSSLFRWEELEELICGSPELDFFALEKGTRYDDGYDANHPTIKCVAWPVARMSVPCSRDVHVAPRRLFWVVLHRLDEDQKCQFLRFATGSDKAPIRGLGSLNLTISKNTSDQDRLPSAHTCFNHLLLPAYADEDVLRERLLVAITQTEGFHIR